MDGITRSKILKAEIARLTRWNKEGYNGGIMHNLKKSHQYAMHLTPQLMRLLKHEARKSNISIAELLQISFHFYMGYQYGLNVKNNKPTEIKK